MNKKIVFITQSKGGSGKSVLCYLLAEKYPDALTGGVALDYDAFLVMDMTVNKNQQPQVYMKKSRYGISGWT